jgi:hypothetical protein
MTQPHRSVGRFAAPLILAASSILFTTASAQNLNQQFLNPPDDAKPMVRWWWFGTAVEKPEILRELQQMKADNIGGAEMAFVYPEVLDDPSKGLKNLAFVSPEFLDNVHYAQAEGRKLGLRIDVTLGSGWPYGGPATTLEEAAGHLRIAEVPVPPKAVSVVPPPLEEGETFISASLVDLLPTSTSQPCGFAHGNVCGGPAITTPRARNVPPEITWNPSTAHPLPITGTPLATSDQPRTALFFISSHTRQQVKRAAVGAEGWVLDPFSHQAVATHLKSVGDPLVKAFGDTPPYAVFSDSLEAYGADWTPTLPTEFKKRRGYDLLPHLPELVAGGTPAAEKIRHDWGQTLTELVDENYLTQINNWAIAHHTKFRSQTYGEPAVSFSSQNIPGLAEGEGPQWRAWSTLRWATSANHIFDHTVTSGETFTWLHSPVFRATPLDMKAEADIDFIMGENQLIFHGWPYSPPDHKVPEPGWSLYAAAVFNDHNPWHPVMPDVTRYIERISFLLRQGKPANQVAILLPTDDAWSHFTPGKVTLTGELTHLVTAKLISSILSAGYNLDFIDADAIDHVGINHPILVIPPTDRIPVATLRKIQQYVASGGKVISVGRAPSLSPEGETTPEITNLSSRLFVAAKNTLVPDESALSAALHQAQKPDFDLTSSSPDINDRVGFIRRRLPTSDIYFVTNTSNEPVEAKVSFGTTHKFGEQWNTDNGSATAAPVNDAKLSLAPYESRVFVFTETNPQSHPAPTIPTTQLADLSTGWQLHFTATGKTESEPTLTDWASDPSTRFYSGEAVYSRNFTFTPVAAHRTILKVSGGKPLPGSPSSPPEHAALGANGLPDPHITRTGPGMHAYYDPPIREAAIVMINGKRAGSLWHPPYRLDITPYLQPGDNKIEIHVYNTALNAWSALPPHDYKSLIAKYGDRFQMQDLDKVEPLPSGILGTIHLLSQDQP